MAAFFISVLVCVACLPFYGADKGMYLARNFFTASFVIDNLRTLSGQTGKYFFMNVVYPATSNLDGL